MTPRQELTAKLAPQKKSDSSHGLRNNLHVKADNVWDKDEWDRKETENRAAVLATENETAARKVAARWGRRVLRSYSSSFYAVTRFLPRDKRADVEMVYAAVRYPDEVVDTFNISTVEKIEELDYWEALFKTSGHSADIKSNVAVGVPVTVAGFRDVLRRNSIPDAYYVDFLAAMRRDIAPSRFTDWNDLIENYIYGSATVVGYFLAHIYGAAAGRTLEDCLRGARSLAIALQLTNFARDVADDAARGRCYLPEHTAANPDSSLVDVVLAQNTDVVLEAKHLLAEEAALWYERARKGVNAFSPDSVIAISSCLRLYSALNDRILANTHPLVRESLSFREKLSVLPKSKYWRLPAALVLER